MRGADNQQDGMFSCVLPKSEFRRIIRCGLSAEWWMIRTSFQFKYRF